MRSLLVIVHRWAGLFIAAFLFVAGLTGAVISWDHELDEWLNPDLFEAKLGGPPLPPLELVARFEAANPQARVTYFPLSYEPGKTAGLFIQPRVNPATGRLFELNYNQAYLEPATGEVRGKRYWGQISLDRRDILPFLYKLHYSMHVPDFLGFDGWGIWLMGIVGIVWMFDCFVGLWLTFPQSKRGATSAIAISSPHREKSWLSRWAPAWRIKKNASAYRMNFDVHRAFGLWTWLFLLILAFTSISMNLGDEVVRPALSKVFSLTPDVGESRTPAPIDKPISPQLSFASVLNIAAAEAAKRSWQEPLGSTFYNQQTGIYSVSFFEAGEEHGSGGMEPKTLYFDGKTGVMLGDSIPWAGTAADIFMQLQFPLHSGRIAGLPGRILLSLMGLVVAVLSLTGIVIWFKKRLVRLKRIEHGNAAVGATGAGYVHVLTPGSYRFIGSLGDENALRLRLSELGEKAALLSITRGALPLGRIALLSGESSFLFVVAIIVGVRRMLYRGGRLSMGTGMLFRSVGTVLFSRNFWQAGMLDASYYVRHVRLRVMRAKG
ncbi:PepSY-associated TM helix domain-containing protein [Hyphomicrobium sp. DY-1]|uniref:PepSY-associated TM helix domain-containing protein n=1 Tax=Hyphomicrobium sp. DY-1 TaxID=3075650 RepID=UPI0039C32524